MIPIEQSNILRVYYAATAEEHVAGRSWYPVARAFCEALAVKYGCTLECAAGIVATLSPGAVWEKNQEQAELVCAAFAKRVWVASKWFPKVGVYGEANRIKCERIWKSGGKILPSGQKVLAFYLCLIGCTDVVCVDRHAVSAMLMEPQELKLKEAAYKRAQAHYVAAAKIAGIPPAELQAVVWVVWRERFRRIYQRGDRIT
jgi:hypothetical protein